MFSAMVWADAACFALGFAWLAWGAHLASSASGIGIDKAWAGGVVPFVLADLLKIALAALAIPASWMLVDRRA
jgi:biotin transport system substrate-specific component